MIPLKELEWHRQKADPWLSGAGGSHAQGWEGTITKKHEENVGGGGYVHYLDCGVGFMPVYVCPL